ncbi:MAG: class I SAM-dependent methyltransferase [Candidatus Rokubacteria bacterium]|nr:class I SAM-dependent methyltransferase [Candidatus Rokubacteria bacterium]
MTVPGPSIAGGSTPYAQPDYYDLAFSTNRETEVAFLLACFRRWARGGVRRVLDIACGTGPHALRLAARGYHVTGIDTSPASLAYLAARARQRRLDVALETQDMADFRVPVAMDAALCLQNSQSYLLTNAEILRHFHSVARAVRPGGLYVFDRYVLSSWRGPIRRWSWAKRRGGLKVRASFSVLHHVDPVAQTYEERLTFDAAQDGDSTIHRQVHRARLVFPQELRALAALAGGFEFVGWFSNFRLDRPLERARRPVMMVTVLRRRAR